MKCFMNSLGFRRLLAVRRTIHEVFYDQTWTQDIIGSFLVSAVMDYLTLNAMMELA
jgi:hypothetical protein